jgi:hypothetical protein
MDNKCCLTLGNFIKDYLSFSIVPFPPKLPMTRTLRIADNNKGIFRGLDIRETGIAGRLSDLVFGKGLQGTDWDE